MPNSIEPPNLGEVLRRLDDVSRQLQALTNELKNDRKEAAELYVRRDVYEEARRFDAAVVHDLNGDVVAAKKETAREIEAMKNDRKADVAARRQVWLALGAMALTLLGIIVTAILNITAR